MQPFTGKFIPNKKTLKIFTKRRNNFRSVIKLKLWIFVMASAFSMQWIVELNFVGEKKNIKLLILPDASKQRQQNVNDEKEEDDEIEKKNGTGTMKMPTDVLCYSVATDQQCFLFVHRLCHLCISDSLHFFPCIRCKLHNVVGTVLSREVMVRGGKFFSRFIIARHITQIQDISIEFIYKRNE